MSIAKRLVFLLYQNIVRKITRGLLSIFSVYIGARSADNFRRPLFEGSLFRLMTIAFVSFSIWMGQTALSQGYLWNSGYNPRIGDAATGTTLSWVIVGGLLTLAGIFPWKRLANHRR